MQIHDSVDVSIRYVKDEKLANEPRKVQGQVPPIFQYLYRRHIINGESANLRAPSVKASSYLNLLVITPDKFKDEVMPLINYHSSTNPYFRYVVKTLEVIGSTHPIDIRDYIKYWYQAYNLYDVLLVGDHDGAYGERLPAFRTNLWC